MKAKITIRNILFLMLSIIALCSVMSMSASAVRFDCEHNLDEDKWTQDASMKCCEIQYCYECEEYAARPIPGSSAHKPGQWKEVTPSTCQAPGLEAIFCTECGVYKMQERAIPQHSFSVIYGEDATCMADGYQFLACLKCFEMKTVILPKDPDAHNFTEWQITTEATCSTDSGVRTKFCLCVDKEGTQCEKTITENYTDSKNHAAADWDNYTEKKAPTCYEVGYLYKICEGCNNKISKELPAHSEATWKVLNVITSTCYTNGIERRECECGLEYDHVLDLNPDNHEYKDWKVTKEPSCTFGKLTRRCKYHYNAIDEKTLLANGEHSFGEWVTIIEPDCSLTGLEKQTCADCGKEVTRVLPTKHDYTYWTTVQNVTCDESNIKDGIKHAKCNSCTFEKDFIIPALHNYGPWIVENLATCKDGNTGSRKRTCSTCGDVERESYVAEHDFTNWYVTSEPVCAKDGLSGFEGKRTRWCRSCGAYEQKAVPVTHEFETVEVISYPDCENSGEIIVKCAYCDKTERQYPDAVDHKFGEAEIGTGMFDAWKPLAESEITCGKAVTEKRTCIYCLETEFNNATVGHAYGNWYCDDGIKCSASGVAPANSLMRKCTRTGCDVIEKNKENISLNHPNAKTVTTEATCTNSGYTREICPDCGNIKLIGDITPAKGHDLAENWTSKVAATCTSKGSRYKACADCDYIEYEELARAEHLIIALETGIEPTCTTPGKSPKSYCAYCKLVFESEDLPALDHKFDAGSEICVRCNAYKGADCTCACHSQSGMEKIFFNLINKLYQLFGINQQCICGALHYEEVGFLAKLFGKG